MPDAFATLTGRAAEQAGYPGVAPDRCLVNRYGAGARMGLHQGRDERDLRAPIISVSLGLPATFLWGGQPVAARLPRGRRAEGGPAAVVG